MKRFKIIHTIRQGKIGGGETHVLSLVKYLDPEKFDSAVLAFTDGELISTLNNLQVKNNIIHTTKPFDFRVWRQVLAYFKAQKPDLIHAHGTRACSNSLWAARKLGVPIIYTIHGWSFHEANGKLVNALRIYSEKYLTEKVDLNINVSNSDKKIGERAFKLTNAAVIENGVDLNFFNPDLNFNSIRKQFGIPERAVLIGHLARMTVQKDPFTLLEAAKLLLDSGRSFYFIFVGGGDLKSELVKRTYDFKIEKFVKFSDFATDVRPFLQSIDIFCLPSLWEGLPIGMLEALAMKKYVVASDLDVHKDMQNRNMEMIDLFSVRSVPALADALILASGKLQRKSDYGKMDNIDILPKIKVLEKYYHDLLKAEAYD